MTRVEQKAVAAITFDLEGESLVLGKRGNMSMFEENPNSDSDPMGCKDSAKPVRVGVKDVVAVRRNIPSRSIFWRWRRRKLIS